jgi:hypothetical protein
MSPTCATTSKSGSPSRISCSPDDLVIVGHRDS